MTGILNLRAIRAEFVKGNSILGKRDPYCTFIFGEQEFQTGVDKKGGKAPHWNELFHFNIGTHDPLLIIRCFDKDHFTKDSMIGEAAMELHDILHPEKIGYWVELKHGINPVGKILIELEYVPLAGTNPTLPTQVTATEKIKESATGGLNQLTSSVVKIKEAATKHLHEEAAGAHIAKELLKGTFAAYKEKIKDMIAEKKAGHHEEKMATSTSTSTSHSEHVTAAPVVTESVVTQQFETITLVNHPVGTVHTETYTSSAPLVEGSQGAGLKENIGEKTTEFKSQAADKYTEFKEHATEKLAGLKDKVHHDKTEESTTDNAGKLNQMRDQATEKLGGLKEQATEKIGELKEKMHHKEKLDESTLPQHRVESNYVGSTTNETGKLTQLKEQATEKLSELKEKMHHEKLDEKDLPQYRVHTEAGIPFSNAPTETHYQDKRAETPIDLMNMDEVKNEGFNQIKATTNTSGDFVAPANLQ